MRPGLKLDTNLDTLTIPPPFIRELLPEEVRVKEGNGSGRQKREKKEKISPTSLDM